MDVAELSTAWNALRNAALGRGTSPMVDAALAKEVADAYEAWRVVLADADPIDDAAASITLAPWVERYCELLAKVKATGQQPQATLTPTPVERATEAAESLAYLLGAGVVVLGLGALLVAVRELRR